MEQEHLDLQETDFGYSLKNILAPTQKEYIFALLGQVQIWGLEKIAQWTNLYDFF